MPTGREADRHHTQEVLAAVPTPTIDILPLTSHRGDSTCKTMRLSIKHSLAWAGYRFASTVLE